MKDFGDLINYSSPAMQERLKLPEGKISEIINGELYVWPSSPSPYHQIVVKRIAFEMDSHADANGLGLTLFAPIDVYLEEGATVICPDIIFIAEENTDAIFDRHGIFGAPDVVIEVLSPHTRRKDTTDKKLLYQAAGVKEYWTVDPMTKDAWGYFLKNNHYDEPLMMHSSIHIRLLNKTITF